METKRIMKEKYIVPNTAVVTVNYATHLLLSSTLPVGGDDDDRVPQKAPRRGLFDSSDDEQ